MEKIDLQAVAALPEQAQSCLKGFKKNTYAASFETYMDENRALWDSFHALFSSAEDITGTAGEVADCLVKTVEEERSDRQRTIAAGYQSLYGILCFSGHPILSGIS